MKKHSNVTVVRKELPTAALWAGAVIAPVLCVTSVLELAVGADKMSTPGILWSVFVIVFTAFYSVDFAKQLRARLADQKQPTQSTQAKPDAKEKKAKK